ncbi:beta-ketoacyl-ACP synthase II [Candidatus Fermentibacterales bacterium]|nr:beta-ketoacyl-ACP synthase II [Candidatus Fermentibacterales bacterium]
MNGQRVVITGMGLISCIGKDTRENWQNAIDGKSGIRRITLIDPEPFTSQVAGEVRGFDPEAVLDRRIVKRADRYTQFALVASRAAWNHAGLSDSRTDPDRLGVIIGTGIGGIGTLEEEHVKALERGVDRISPFFCPMMIGNMASGMVAIDLGAKGINFATMTACATSGHAIAASYDAIKLGRADVIMAGGSEAPITVMGLGGFCALKAVSTRNDDPPTASRPFDRGRDGFVMAEGAAVVVLEEYEHARKRGAEILAELIGIGMTCDAYHMTAPPEGGEGAARSMSLAMREAGLAPEDVAYLNAHGTSTELNDIYETQAIKTAFGEDVARKKLLVSSTKSVTGHMLGAAGAMELALTVLAMRESVIPPTATLEVPGEGCDLDYVPREARKADIRYALTNSFGFGGHNVTLAIGRV